MAVGTAAGENIGVPITATDADADTLTYTLGGADATSFGIDPASGQLHDDCGERGAGGRVPTTLGL